MGAPMTKELPDTEDLLAELGFRCPELGPALSRVSVTWDDTVPTACVDWHGRIKISPKYADKALQALAHEIMHLVGEHFVDMPAPQYDPMLANIAGDMWLNAILEDLIPGLTWPKEWLYAQGQDRDKTARELYEDLKKNAKQVKVSFGAGCGVQGPKPTDPADAQ